MVVFGWECRGQKTTGRCRSIRGFPRSDWWGRLERALANCMIAAFTRDRNIPLPTYPHAVAQYIVDRGLVKIAGLRSLP